MEIVCFDTQFYADGESKKLEGVTQLFQQDKSLVTVLLDEMIAKFGEGVRLIKVWRGPNYNSPFDRREVGWQEYEAAGKIKTVGQSLALGLLVMPLPHGDAHQGNFGALGVVGEVFFYVGRAALAAAAILTLWSGFEFYREVWRQRGALKAKA